jgi:ABC-type transport system involved in cytochrome bd biosynthesis fused ATPase/permease subunit
MRVLLGAAAACVVLAVVVGLATSSDLGTGVTITLGGTAFVLLLSAAFYAVGRSEDRARARDEQQR